jgi:hypothetical protein
MKYVSMAISAVGSAPAGVLVGSGHVGAGLLWLAVAAVLYLLWGWYYCSETAARRSLYRKQRRLQRPVRTVTRKEQV